MKIDAYIDIRTEQVSIRSRETEDYGIVVDKRPKVGMRDVEFVIQPGSQQTCRESGVKNVHAVVRGKMDDSVGLVFGERVIYNPFEYDCFVEADRERPVRAADEVLVTKNGVFSKGLTYGKPKCLL